MLLLEKRIKCIFSHGFSKDAVLAVKHKLHIWRRSDFWKVTVILCLTYSVSFCSLLSGLHPSVIHSAQLNFRFPRKEKKSSTCCAVFRLPLHFYPSILESVLRPRIVLKVIRELTSFTQSSRHVPAMADPLNQSAKLDFNGAIVFIKSNPCEQHSQGSEQQTDGWVYQHIGMPLGLQSSLKVRLKLSSGNRPQIWLVCLEQNNPFGW